MNQQNKLLLLLPVLFLSGCMITESVDYSEDQATKIKYNIKQKAHCDELGAEWVLNDYQYVVCKTPKS